MRQRVPSDFLRVGDSVNPFVLCSSSGSTFEIHFLDEDVVRVLHRPPTVEASSCTGTGLVLLNEFTRTVQPQLIHSGLLYILETRSLSIEIDLEDKDLRLSWTCRDSTDAFLEDLPFRAYEYDLNGGCNHYLKTRDGDIHYGLGERTSPLSLNGRRFRLECCDALGYNSETTDPLYKLVPYYLTMDKKTRNAFGIYYDSLCSGTMDFGCEIDALWGNYRVYRSQQNYLNYYVFHGPSLAKCVSTFAKLVGKPAMVPKYALGYLASSMGYAEAENAQDLIEAFPALCQKWDIPCDLLHLSSGYTVDPKTGARNVFTWNNDRFPDPKRMFETLYKAGIKTVANVKPWLLSQHPNYGLVKSERGFVWDLESDQPNLTRLWSGGAGETSSGSFFDFTSPSGRNFWKNGVQKLLALGITGIWNDNNEFCLPDDEHVYHDGADSTVGSKGRLLQTIKMATASYEALCEFDSSRRPFLITRAGAQSVSRYASQTWSGDNFSSWHSLKHNIPIGLNAGLSLFSGYGHDVGGFFGPRPSAELFVRWVQNGIFHPRFCIHSWKKEGITEPWMYPEVTDIVREAIKLRYTLIPYLYNLSFQAHNTGIPVIRPLVLEFQMDSNVDTSSFDFMLGPHLLVSSVYEEGINTKDVYLPMSYQSQETHWCDVWTGQWYHGGRTVHIDVPLKQHGALFALQGALIPTGKCMQYVGAVPDDTRIFWCFPPPVSTEEGLFTSETVLTEDDGESMELITTEIHLTMTARKSDIDINIQILKSDFKLAYSSIGFLMPVGDKRLVKCKNGVRSFEASNGAMLHWTDL